MSTEQRAGDELLVEGLRLRSREAVLAHAEALILQAWRSFDQARPGQPAVDERVRAMLLEALPEEPSDPRGALDAAALVLDESVAQSRPRFFAYVGSSGLEIGVLGDALMASHDVNVAVAAGGAGLLERQVVGWVSDFVGFGARDGLLASGGMVSNLTALAAARERAAPGVRHLGVRDRRLTLVCSAEAHYSVHRAAEVLGIGSDNVRLGHVDAQHRIDVRACAQLLEADRVAGALAVAVVATAGTTLTGAVDDLASIADLCGDRGVWLHVDGAYGLPAAAAPSVRDLFAGLGRADSATVDAHKWMFVPKACSVLLMRDPLSLRAAFEHRESYMPLVDGEDAHPVDSTLEYSRPLRALKLWLAFRVHGAGALRAAIERNLGQARLLARLLEEHPRFELCHQPQLSTVCFRHRPSSKVNLEDHHRRLVPAIQLDGRIFLAGALTGGSSCLRACFVNFRTIDDDVRAIVEVVDEVGQRLAEAGSNSPAGPSAR